MDHLQLPGYDPIATAGPSRFDPRAAEQALGFFTQLLPLVVMKWTRPLCGSAAMSQNDFKTSEII
jgi:hypothetical protein